MWAMSVGMAAWASMGAVATEGSAPDDGPGVAVHIGDDDGCGPLGPSGDHRVLRMALLGPGRSVLEVGTPAAEALLCQPVAGCAAASAGVVVVDHVSDRGIRGRYALTVGDQRVEGLFDAPWCGAAPPTAGPGRPRGVEAFDVAGHEGVAVALRGFVVTTGGVARLASSVHETAPPRAAGPSVPLVASADTLRAWANGSAAVVRGQVRGGALVVYSME